MRFVIAAVLLMLAGPIFAAGPAQPDRPGLTLSGDARMGIVYNGSDDRFGQSESGLRMSSRARLHLKFRGQTDGGLHFGADVTLDKHQNATGGSVSIGQ